MVDEGCCTARAACRHFGLRRSTFWYRAKTPSPWVSRLLEGHGCRCVVANTRKLRAICTNERKCDQLDVRMLVKLARADEELLSPIQHGSLEHQEHRLVLTMRDSLVRQRVDIITSIRFSL